MSGFLDGLMKALVGFFESFLTQMLEGFLTGLIPQA
jgi:hypothetical protein